MSPIDPLMGMTSAGATKLAVPFIAEHDDPLQGPCLTCIKKLATVDLMRLLYGVDTDKFAMLVACFRIERLGIESGCTEEGHDRIER